MLTEPIDSGKSEKLFFLHCLDTSILYVIGLCIRYNVCASGIFLPKTNHGIIAALCKIES